MPYFETPAPSDGAAAVDWTLVGWIVTAAIAVLAVIVTVIVTRQFGNRRAVLTWFAEATPLVPQVASHLEVTYRDISVPDPVLLTVVLVNSGPRDISSAMFDDKRPIRVKLGARFYGITRTDGATLVVPSIGTSAEDAEILMEPLLMKRRQSWSFSAVVSGEPEVTLGAPLIDTDVRELSPMDREGSIWSALAETLLGVGEGMGGILGALASFFVGNGRKR